MREILYRGASIKNGKWFYGSLIDSGNHTQVLIFPYTSGASSFSVMDLVQMEAEAVDPDTVGEFSGIADLKNQRIFEGDIVKARFRRNGKCFNFHCIFLDGAFVFTNGYTFVSAKDLVDMEVVGTVYDSSLETTIEEQVIFNSYHPPFYSRYMGIFNLTNGEKSGVDGGLVSRGELKKRINEILLLAEPNDFLHPYVKQAVKAYSDCVFNAIDRTRDAEFQPLGYGKWIKLRDGSENVRCSICGTIEKPGDSNFRSKNCPGCGVRMMPNLRGD